MKLSKIGYYLLKGVSRMPFWFIYFLSDVAAWTLFFVVRYRRKVVMDNLRLCFPDESPSWVLSPQPTKNGKTSSFTVFFLLQAAKKRKVVTKW